MWVEIWSQRNQVRLQQSAIPLHLISQQAKDRYSEFLTAQSSIQEWQIHPKCKLQAPLENYAKINFDTAIFVGDNKSGIGVVIRDKNSLVIASCSQVLQHAYSSNEIEALAGSCYCVFQEARIFSLHVWIWKWKKYLYIFERVQYKKKLLLLVRLTVELAHYELVY